MQNPHSTLVAVNVSANAQVFYFDHSKGGKGSKCKGSEGRVRVIGTGVVFGHQLEKPQWSEALSSIHHCHLPGPQVLGLLEPLTH